jgi:hypothetical protein
MVVGGEEVSREPIRVLRAACCVLRDAFERCCDSELFP